MERLRRRKSGRDPKQKSRGDARSSLSEWAVNQKSSLFRRCGLSLPSPCSSGTLDSMSIKFLAAGVDLFFVISGFIMVVSCWPEFGKPYAPRRFIVRRLVRIVPLYWLATLFMMVVVCYGQECGP